MAATLALAATTTSLAQSPKLFRVGVLTYGAATPGDSKAVIADLEQGFANIGYVEGRDIELRQRDRSDLYIVRTGSRQSPLWRGGQLSGGASNFTRTVGAPQNWPVAGDWTIDDSERICASLRINYAQGASIIPKRCQFWFKLAENYYESDSDEDRSEKVLVRVLRN